MDSVSLRLVGLGLSALSLVGCGRRGPLGDEISALRTTVDSSYEVLQALDSAEFMTAFNRMERHIDVAKTKTYDASREAIFRVDFDWLRNSHRALFKFESLRRGERWDGQLVQSRNQLEALHHDWSKRLISEDSVRVALEEEKNAVLPLLATLHTRLDEVRYVLGQNDSLDLHFQKLWDNWDSAGK